MNGKYIEIIASLKDFLNIKPWSLRKANQSQGIRSVGIAFFKNILT